MRGVVTMKLNKQLAILHSQALELVYSDKALTEDERYFILEHYHEAGNNANTLSGAFFTPLSLAKDFAVMNDYNHHRIVDLCAGIGRLSYHYQNRYSWSKRTNEITCIEVNPEYVDVGKRTVPEANWILADIFSVDYQSLGQFDLAISNPPFGKIKTGNNFTGSYTGSDFEFKCLELASTIAKNGAFILPQESSPFKYSGSREYIETSGWKFADFLKKSNFNSQFFCCSIDTSHVLNDWRNVKPLCEVIEFDFLEQLNFKEQLNNLSLAMDSKNTDVQLGLF